MIIITPNLRFDGKCEEAINLYKKAFNAKTNIFIRYKDRDVRDYSEPLTKERENHVLHAEIRIGEQRIMMSDSISADSSKSPNTACTLTATFDSAEGVKNAYENLKENSVVIVPLHTTTYSSCHCSLIDKFGIRWSLMTEQTKR